EVVRRDLLLAGGRAAARQPRKDDHKSREQKAATATDGRTGGCGHGCSGEKEPSGLTVGFGFVESQRRFDLGQRLGRALPSARHAFGDISHQLVIHLNGEDFFVALVRREFWHDEALRYNDRRRRRRTWPLAGAFVIPDATPLLLLQRG